MSDSLKFAIHDLFFISKIMLLIYFVMVGARLFGERPYVYAISPGEYTRFEDAAPTITLGFTVPVNPDDITFHLSPEIKGEWQWGPTFMNLPLHREVIFVPHESFYPGSHVIVYIVGIHQVWYPWQSHEHALSYDAPIIPWVKSITPTHQSEEVAVNLPLEVELNANAGRYLGYQFVIAPDPGPYETVIDGKSISLNFEELLSQDTTYTVDIHQTPLTYDALTKVDLVRGDTQKIGSTSFSTVSSPLIENFEPQGSSVLTDREVLIVFDQEMVPESVIAHLDVQPRIVGNVQWDDARTLRIVPSEPLEKDTEYSLTLQEGIQSVNGGFTEEAAVLGFRSIGKIKVIGAAPLNGSSGARVDGVQFRIDFNQEVELQSAQDLFVVSPPTSGSFGWEGNTMTYTPASKLAYGTTYTYTVSSGVKTVHGIDSDEAFTSTFTTRANIFTLGIPYYKQEEGFTCNITATRMVLAYRGVSLSEDSIQSVIGYGSNPNTSWVEGYGTHTSPIASYIGVYRDVEVKSAWNLTELLQQVQNGNPVIVWWYNRYSQPAGTFTLADGSTGYNGMHSEVVRGFIGDISNPSHVLTNDPWRGQLTYTRAQFESTWGYMGNTALIVY